MRKSKLEILWIGADQSCDSPIILRRFYVTNVGNIEKATLTITGLGFFEASINGSPVTEQRFLPVVSDYEARDFSAFLYPLKDVTTHRIYYYEFDVTSWLKNGENTLEIWLGNGWYRQTERLAEGNTTFGQQLKATYQLALHTSVGTETLYADGSETWFASEIQYNNLFYGEVVDPGAVTGEEKPVRLLPAPEAIYSKAIGTPDKVIRRITPRPLGIINGKTIFDVGENISGVVQVHTKAPKGERITLRFAENKNEDGTLNFDSTGAGYQNAAGVPQIMQDVFVADGRERDFSPKFEWHAFRYFDIEGSFDSVEVLVIHSDTPVTATFSADSEGLEYLFETFLRTQLNNMHGSIPSDCPHRERLGYTGDGQVCAPAAMLMLDCRDFYEKWIQDILDCQDKVGGHVQHTAPFMGGGGGPGGWGCAIVLVPYAFYQQYGEKTMLEKCYDPMRHWLLYLQNHCENGLVVREEEGGWCLGDWCTLENIALPAAYVNSCYLVKILRILEEIAPIIGEKADKATYIQLRQQTEQAIRSAFWDADKHTYANGVQGADAYAVWCQMEGAEIAKQVAEQYDALGHFDTGFLGTDILMEVLLNYGYADVALKLLESEVPGSFLYMKRHGATTLWEDWLGKGSHNHPMFGACARQLFTSILGIRQREGTVGYSHVIIAPRVPKGLSRASGSIQPPKGRIAVSWEKREGKVHIEVQAPESIHVEIAAEEELL